MERYHDIILSNNENSRVDRVIKMINEQMPALNENSMKEGCKMRKKSRRSRHENLFNSFTCNITNDKNRIFCIRQCIIYTGRLMHCLPILDQETLDFIQWLIPDENENIVQIVIDMLSKKEKAFFSDEILQCTENPATYPQEIDTITEKFSRGKIQRLVDRILQILEKKCKQLQYQGNSELETGMASLKKMFNLTDGEEKLCWLFFICAKWRQAQNYFMDHIEFNDFSRRSYLLAVLDMDHREFTAILNGNLQKIEALDNDLSSVDLSTEFLNYLDSPSSEKLTKAVFYPHPQENDSAGHITISPKRRPNRFCVFYRRNPKAPPIFCSMEGPVRERQPMLTDWPII